MRRRVVLILRPWGAVGSLGQKALAINQKRFEWPAYSLLTFVAVAATFRRDCALATNQMRVLLTAGKLRYTSKAAAGATAD